MRISDWSSDVCSSDLDALATHPPRTERWTSISAAIDVATMLFDGNGFEGTRQVIDMSGDGYNNSGRPVTAARDAAGVRGIPINGLPILNGRPGPGGWTGTTDSEPHTRHKGIGRPGALVLPPTNCDY